MAQRLQEVTLWQQKVSDIFCSQSEQSGDLVAEVYRPDRSNWIWTSFGFFSAHNLSRNSYITLKWYISWFLPVSAGCTNESCSRKSARHQVRCPSKQTIRSYKLRSHSCNNIHSHFSNYKHASAFKTKYFTSRLICCCYCQLQTITLVNNTSRWSTMPVILTEINATCS